MSVSRKDWSALSSLARQRTLEDEEEQERERRRRHRHLSSTADDEAPRPTQNGGRPAMERLPSVEEAKVPRSPPAAFKDEEEDVQAILRTRQERRQRRQVVEGAQAPVLAQLEAEEGRDSSGPGQVPKKEAELPPRRRLSQEQRGPWAREEESLAGREPGGWKKGVSEKTPAPDKSPVSGKSSVPETTLAPEKRLVSEETSVSEKGPGPKETSVLGKTAVSEKRPITERKAVLEKTGISEKPPAPGKMSGSERRLVSEKASIFEKSPATETKLAPKRAAASEQSASGGSPSSTKEQGGRALPEKSPQASAELGEQGALDRPAVASRLPPITLQVKIPSKEDEVDAALPTQATFSSSLKRSSPRTISFRMSSRKDNSETGLTRSASVRLPASTVKLGEKLERYHTAVQRSESVKSPGSSRTEFLVAPVGVASKRHLFEKELVGQSRAEPASSRKENLKLSGVVTSRLNLWISRSQGSGDQDPQEVQKESAAARRTPRGSKAEPSLDVEV
ncbi:PREDICTED: ladinin-1 [Ceratotherium simum simum]|uniref:Ladinin-1 n=1 Tax=Ceratotherium simum simum TaxID=73337 RepID=A0ABM1DCT6_CERSS|nr:PREDICTED: ladinin-1 [Ceratotherium simum simum]